MNDLALNVAIEIICGAVLLVIIVSQWMNTDRHTKVNHYFLAELCLLFVTLTIDTVSWIIDGKTGIFFLALAYITNFISYITSFLVAYYFILFISESLPLTGRVKKFVYRVAQLNLVIYIAAFIVSQFNGIIYYIDENNLFHWGTLYWLPHVVVSLLNIIILWAVILNRKKLEFNAVLSYVSYAIIPLLVDGVNIFYYQMVLIYPAMTIALLIIFVNIQMQRDRKLKEQELIMQNQQMALKLSQIQPHFVFNTLTAIKSLYRTDPAQAEITLNNFSRHLRTTIDTPNMPDMIYFRDELRNVYTYLSIEQQRFKNRFEVEYDIGERFFFIPPLTLQPIVENAVLHGLTIGKGGSKLVIKTDETLAEYIITVIDDGNGFIPSVPPGDGKSHVGIENIRFRLAVLCNGRLRIDSQPGKGTKVTIIIPKDGENK